MTSFEISHVSQMTDTQNLRVVPVVTKTQKAGAIFVWVQITAQYVVARGDPLGSNTFPESSPCGIR